MLKLVDIKKNYIMKDQDPVRALRGISLSFRRNEFVAILGPSGCGKTTLLNIIGGLDRYSDGDLIIKDKSTKNYKDHDWDTYRNHSVGFVFQAYNLIGHQSVQRNVELALTIGGVSRKERKERALRALERVGLKGMEKKRPNQLSGGQMQRVAIARALVNNPEILLADEPTGALDSETSIQIMDLLEEVAKDRLVIMVTHNPDLANKYATRIVNMFDGVITGDTNPFDGVETEKKKAYRCPKCGTIVREKVERCPKCGALAKYPEENVEQEPAKNKKSSMSFLTATSLSLSNLFSKSKRTILVAIAGSIGIFGVSTVLAASTGVRRYIDDMQDDMLSSYPLTIAEESVDYTSLMTGLYADPDPKIATFDPSTEVGLNSMIDYMMDKYSDLTSVKTNTINDDLVQFVKEIPEEYVSAISYSYGIDPTNNIFTKWVPHTGSEPMEISLNGLTQRYIQELRTVKGFEQYASYVDLFTDFMKLLPGDQDYILTQYDLLGNSHFPENENEIMLVVEGDTTLTDLVFAQMGYYYEEEVMDIAKKAIRKYDSTNPATEEELSKYEYRSAFSYTELLDKEFTYYPHDSIYRYGEVADSAYNEYSIVLRTNPANDEFYSLTYSDNTTTSLIKGVIYTGQHITTNPVNAESVYAIKMKDGFSPSSMSGDDIDYSELIADPEEVEDPTTGTFLCISSENARKLVTDPSSLDASSMSFISIGSGEETTGIVVTLNPETFDIESMSMFSCTKDTVSQTAKSGYQYPAIVNKDPSDPDRFSNGTPMKIAGILRPKKGVSFGCLSRGVYYTKAFQDKYMNDAFNSKVVRGPNSFINFIDNGGLKTSTYDAYVTYTYTNWEDPDHPDYNATYYASSLNGDLSSSFTSLFSSITGADYETENETHFRSLCGLKINPINDENGQLKEYHYEKLPEMMSIYPVDFEFKDKVTNYLDDWNKNVDITLYDGTEQVKVLHKDARDELTYTDTISLIINVIDTMITIITTALVIFTSLSLVVSSFMIAVITYISVMERVKEIGVIRSLGGRKKDVSRLFIAENLVTGVMSGIIGLAITGLVCLIINLIIAQFGVPAIAVLTLPIAGIMLALSVFLSVMAGLIPSMHASRQDPVIALRSE